MQSMRMRPMATEGVAWSVSDCLCVGHDCDPCKMAEQIELPFVRYCGNLWGPKNRDAGPDSPTEKALWDMPANVRRMEAHGDAAARRRYCGNFS